MYLCHSKKPTHSHTRNTSYTQLKITHISFTYIKIYNILESQNNISPLLLWLFSKHSIVGMTHNHLENDPNAYRGRPASRLEPIPNNIYVYTKLYDKCGPSRFYNTIHRFGQCSLYSYCICLMLRKNSV